MTFGLKWLYLFLFFISVFAHAQPLESWANDLMTEKIVPCDGNQYTRIFHPKPGYTIYVRQMQVWPWPQHNWTLPTPTGYVAIQKWSNNTTEQTFMDMKWFYGTPNAKASPEFAGGSMRLGPNDRILIELACYGTQFIPGFIPRYQVLWTDTP